MCKWYAHDASHLPLCRGAARFARVSRGRGPVVVVIIGPHRFLTPWVCASSTATPLRWSGCRWIIGPRPWPRACEVSRPDRLDVRVVRLAFQTCCGLRVVYILKLRRLSGLPHLASLVPVCDVRSWSGKMLATRFVCRFCRVWLLVFYFRLSSESSLAVGPESSISHTTPFFDTPVPLLSI